MAERWPNFFLVGAMKAGTTSIANVLALHPDIFICPVKEPNYFCTDLAMEEEYAANYREAGMHGRSGMKPEIHSGVIRDERQYLSLFRGWSNEKVGGECSTSYLYSTAAAENIQSANPDARILIVLRNPVERAFSEFLMNCSIGVAVPPFSKYLDVEREQRLSGVIPQHHKYVTAGLYFRQVSKYLENFPPDQVLILLYDDLKEDFHGFMERVWRFLAVNEPVNGGDIRSNAAKYPRWAYINMILKKTGAKRMAQEMLPVGAKEYFKKLYYGPLPADLALGEADRLRLIEEFLPDIRELSRLLNRNLDAWLA